MPNSIKSRIGQIVYQFKVKRNPLVKLLSKELKELLNETHQCEVTDPPNSTLTTDNPPLPLEQSHSKLAKEFELIASGKHPVVKALMVDITETTFYLHSGKVHHTKHE